MFICNCEVARSRLNFLLKARIGFLKLNSHTIELFSEFLKLVTGFDLNAGSEFTSADLMCRGLQLPDRNDHPAFQQQSGENGDQKAKKEQPRGANQKRVNGLQGLL